MNIARLLNMARVSRWRLIYLFYGGVSLTQQIKMFVREGMQQIGQLAFANGPRNSSRQHFEEAFIASDLRRREQRDLNSHKSMSSKPSQRKRKRSSEEAFDYHSSKILPSWLKNYTTWHQERRLLLNESNWKEQKYLIQRCDDKCSGGDSDCSLPASLLLAARMQRLLFIHSRRPSKVQAIQSATPHGLDWRVPDWLVSKPDIRETGLIKSSKQTDIDRAMRSNATFVFSKACWSQSDATRLYNLQRKDDEADVDALQQEVWKLLFQSS
ncbi:hypothetical protein MPSEU_000867400 [Mayamaea pseudoterrestris]|nr:hypothetical protein MPSEU_000867400 [Mayamaea pseudoterrestris]